METKLEIRVKNTDGSEHKEVFENASFERMTDQEMIDHVQNIFDKWNETETGNEREPINIFKIEIQKHTTLIF